MSAVSPDWETNSASRPCSQRRLAVAELRGDVDLGLRHRLLRRPDRQVLVRAPGPPAGRDRRRLRVPLPRAAAASRGGWRCSSRSRARPPTRSPRCATPRRRGSTIVAVVNVPTSTIARESARRRCRRSPAPRSASPRPRPSPASSPCCSASPIAAGRARGTLVARRRRPAGRRARSQSPRLMAEALKLEHADRGARRATSPRRATCSISAAAPSTRSRSKAR